MSMFEAMCRIAGSYMRESMGLGSPGRICVARGQPSVHSMAPHPRPDLGQRNSDLSRRQRFQVLIAGPGMAQTVGWPVELQSVRSGGLSLFYCSKVLMTAGDSLMVQPLVVAKLTMLDYMEQCLLLRYGLL